MASVASIGVALGFRKLLKKRASASTGAKLYLINTFSSFLACAASCFLNAWIMRQTEIQKGIDVLDKETNEVVGKSKKCAKKAVL